MSDKVVAAASLEEAFRLVQGGEARVALHCCLCYDDPPGDYTADMTAVVADKETEAVLGRAHWCRGAYRAVDGVLFVEKSVMLDKNAGSTKRTVEVGWEAHLKERAARIGVEMLANLQAKFRGM